MEYDNDACLITYTKDFIDKNEIQFNIVDVETKSGLNIWDHPLTIHYYPLRGQNKISYCCFPNNENLERLKSAIVTKVLENEQM
ncbi:MAG TPA: hypothetical protein VIL78_15620 [Hanamia sp.]